MQVAQPLGVEPIQPGRRERRQRRRVVDDDYIWRQAAACLRQHVFDHGIVLEHQVHTVCATHRLGRRGRHFGAERLHRPRLVGRAVPDGDGVTPFGGGFGECGAEQAGAEVGDGCHVAGLL